MARRLQARIRPLVLAAPAVAQPPDDAGRAFTIEGIDDGWVVAPDFRFTEVDDELAAAIGVYGGYQLDRRLLIGAGAYWLKGGRTDLSYFGPLIEWSTKTGGRFDVSIGALVGVGSATRYALFGDPFDTEVDNMRDNDAISFSSHGGHRFGRGAGPRFGRGFGSYYDEFAVAEPHVSFLTRATDWLGVNVGVGYRATNSDFGGGDGGSFSVGLRSGPS